MPVGSGGVFSQTAVSVTIQSYFPGDRGVFVKGLYPREAETNDHSSSKQTKWDLRAKQGFGYVCPILVLCQNGCICRQPFTPSDRAIIKCYKPMEFL